MQSYGRFIVRPATERGNIGLKGRKGLEMPSQGTRVPLSFKEAHLLEQVRQYLHLLYMYTELAVGNLITR